MLDFVGLVVVWLLRPATGTAPVAARLVIRRLLALGALVVGARRRGRGPGVGARDVAHHRSRRTAACTTSPPSQVNLRFSEPVEVALGGIRVYTSDRDRVVTGSPEHPNGAQSEVAASLPKLDDGTYVVTWRVDVVRLAPHRGRLHVPGRVEGDADQEERARAWRNSLLAATGGSKTVGVLYGIDRGVAVRRARAAHRRCGVPRCRVASAVGRTGAPRWVVWAGWIGVVVTTVLGIALEGVYAAGLSLSKVFDPSVFRDVLDTRLRQGRARPSRAARGRVPAPADAAAPARREPTRPLPGVVDGRGRTRRRGLRGDARASPVTRGTGIQTGLAIPADLVHVAGMACWLGGLVVLCVAVLPRKDVDELRTVLPRYSALAARRDRRARRVGRVPGVAPGRQHRRAQEHRLREAAHRQAGRVRGVDHRRRVQPRDREPALPRPASRRRHRSTSSFRCRSAWACRPAGMQPAPCRNGRAAASTTTATTAGGTTTPPTRTRCVGCAARSPSRSSSPP